MINNTIFEIYKDLRNFNNIHLDLYSFVSINFSFYYFIYIISNHYIDNNLKYYHKHQKTLLFIGKTFHVKFSFLLFYPIKLVSDNKK